MKKVLEKIRKYKLLVVGIIIGGILFGGGVYAAVIGAENVSYSTASSGMYSNTVQGAIDELYKKSETFVELAGTALGPIVVKELYPNDSFTTLKDMDHLEDRVGSEYNSAMNTCVVVQKKDKTLCDKQVKASVLSSYCGKNETSKYKDALKNVSSKCTEKCLNNDTCYKKCMYAAIDFDWCTDYYLEN